MTLESVKPDVPRSSSYAGEASSSRSVDVEQVSALPRGQPVRTDAPGPSRVRRFLAKLPFARGLQGRDVRTEADAATRARESTHAQEMEKLEPLLKTIRLIEKTRPGRGGAIESLVNFDRARDQCRFKAAMNDEELHEARSGLRQAADQVIRDFAGLQGKSAADTRSVYKALYKMYFGACERALRAPVNTIAQLRQRRALEKPAKDDSNITDILRAIDFLRDVTTSFVQKDNSERKLVRKLEANFRFLTDIKDWAVKQPGVWSSAPDGDKQEAALIGEFMNDPQDEADSGPRGAQFSAAPTITWESALTALDMELFLQKLEAQPNQIDEAVNQVETRLEKAGQIASHHNERLQAAIANIEHRPADEHADLALNLIEATPPLFLERLGAEDFSRLLRLLRTDSPLSDPAQQPGKSGRAGPAGGYDSYEKAEWTLYRATRLAPEFVAQESAVKRDLLDKLGPHREKLRLARDNWPTLSDQDKLDVVRMVSAAHHAAMNCPPPKEIILADLQKGITGDYSNRRNVIRINRKAVIFNDFESVMGTVLHEGSHNRQYRLAEHVRGKAIPENLRPQAELFELNTRRYVDSKKDEDTYKKQPMEAHSFRAGAKLSRAVMRFLSHDEAEPGPRPALAAAGIGRPTPRPRARGELT